MENQGFELEQEDGVDISKKGLGRETKITKVYTFEEAVALTGTGKFHYFLILICGFCFMTVMVETMGISVIMPYLKCDLESTVAEQGILASAGFFGIVLSSHAMGFLADTWGRVKTLRAALIFSFITTVISAFSVNIWMLIVFRFFNGFFISGCQACVFSFLGEFHGSKTRVRYVTLLSIFMPIGLIFLPGISMGILPLQINTSILGLNITPWRLLLLADSLLSLLALCGLFAIPESPKFVLIQNKNDEAIKTFRKVFRLNTGRPESEYPVEQVYIETSGANLSEVHGVKDALKLIWSQTVPLFHRERVWHTINICCIMFVIYGTAQGIFMWFPTMLDQLVAKSGQGYLVCESMYMLNEVSKNATAVADNCGGPVNTGMLKVLTIIGVGFTLIYVVFAFIVEKVGKKNLLMAWLFLTLVSCLAIHWVSSFILSVILLTLIMGSGNCGGIVSTISVEFFPTNINAMAMCLIMMIGRLGAVAGSNFVGLFIFSNCDALFYSYVGVVACVALFSIFLPDKRRKKEPKDKMRENAVPETITIQSVE